jgi:hypothetical protein
VSGILGEVREGWGRERERERERERREREGETVRREREREEGERERERGETRRRERREREPLGWHPNSSGRCPRLRCGLFNRTLRAKHAIWTGMATEPSSAAQLRSNPGVQHQMAALQMPLTAWGTGHNHGRGCTYFGSLSEQCKFLSIDCIKPLK